MIVRERPGQEAPGTRGAARRGALLLLCSTLTMLILLCGSASATVTLPGSPLAVSIGPEGQCQSSYSNAGNNFFPGEGTEGDCGFFLGFPESGNPGALQKKVFGFAGIGGPRLGATEYTAVSPGTATGSGTSADPYKLVTQFKVTDAATKLDYALITETTTYVNGEPQFTSKFDVQNVTGQTISGLTTAPSAPLRFHAIYAGDLFTNDSDFRTGVFLSGPPRFIGGQNTTSGALGGFIEVGPPSPRWTDFQTGCWNEVPEPLGRCSSTSPNDGGIWHAVRAAGSEAPVFNGDIDPNPIDNAAGVSWDDHLSSQAALKPGEHSTYSIVNRAQIPTGLVVQPVSQTHVAGQTATVTVTAKDNAGMPYGDRPIVYSIGETNPKSGSVDTDASGQATISYVGTAAGLDTMQLFLDLNGNGVRDPNEPSSTAQITWSPAAPTPSSSYQVKSIKANADGTITIVFVPAQNGTATVEVTVPTAAISRNAPVAKRKKCKRNQVRIKGKCRPRTSVSGKATAAGTAKVPLKITVEPSTKVKQALAEGEAVQLTAKLAYRSTLGGTSTVKVYHFTVKPKKKKKHH